MGWQGAASYGHVYPWGAFIIHVNQGMPAHLHNQLSNIGFFIFSKSYTVLQVVQALTN